MAVVSTKPTKEFMILNPTSKEVTFKFDGIDYTVESWGTIGFSMEEEARFVADHYKVNGLVRVDAELLKDPAVRIAKEREGYQQKASHISNNVLRSIKSEIAKEVSSIGYTPMYLSDALEHAEAEFEFVKNRLNELSKPIKNVPDKVVESKDKPMLACDYCGKELSAPIAKTNHEKACKSNPKNVVEAAAEAE